MPQQQVQMDRQRRTVIFQKRKTIRLFVSVWKDADAVESSVFPALEDSFALGGKKTKLVRMKFCHLL